MASYFFVSLQASRFVQRGLDGKPLGHRYPQLLAANGGSRQVYLVFYDGLLQGRECFRQLRVLDEHVSQKAAPGLEGLSALRAARLRGSELVLQVPGKVRNSQVPDDLYPSV